MEDHHMNFHKKYKQLFLQDFKKDNSFSRKGMIALPAVIALAAIILAIGLAMSFSSFTQNNISSNKYKSEITYRVAEAGIKDAMIKITRNKNYDTAFALLINNGAANVSFDTSVHGQTKITSIGTFDNNTKTIEVILDITTNGKTAISSWTEL